MFGRSRKYDNKKLMWLKAGEEFAVFVIVAFIVFRFIVGVSWISGKSMYPTFKDGQPVFYNRMSSHFEKGDVVSFRMPSGEYIIKRVVAVAGDTVDVHDGAFWINGEKETGDYINGETYPEEGNVEYPITLHLGQFFALGDNREVSIDSRTIGPVSETQARGKIFTRK